MTALIHSAYMRQSRTILTLCLFALVVLVAPAKAEAHHTKRHTAQITNRQVVKCRKARVTPHRHCRVLVSVLKNQRLGAWWAWTPSLQKLWHRESGWRVYALNGSSGACGIPQSLPCSKMRSAGPNHTRSSRTQLRWGVRYIKRRYGSPQRAWRFWQSRHWY